MQCNNSKNTNKQKILGENLSETSLGCGQDEDEEFKDEDLEDVVDEDDEDPKNESID